MTRFWSLFGQECPNGPTQSWANLASQAYAYKITHYVTAIPYWQPPSPNLNYEFRLYGAVGILSAMNATTTTFVVEQPEEIVKQS